ncbi:MAG: adenylate/guanylate cyclase domain-containing protein [Rhodothermaceae bacterium]
MHLKLHIKQLSITILFWIFTVIFFVIVRNYGLEEVLNVPPFNPFSIMPELIISSIFIGTIIFFMDIFFEKIFENKVTYISFVLLKSLSYLLLLTAGSFIFNVVSALGSADIQINLQLIFNEYYIDNQLNTFVTYLYFSVVFILYNFLQQIRNRFAPGVLSKIFLGKFYEPKEVQRIFMFLDLKSSTTYAETLGHIKYSELIKNCFNDLTESVLKHKSEIYQYAGDCVVLTWNIKNGLSKDNCFNFFFSFENSINKRKDYYQNKFGLIPEFKAGLNMGSATITEVGEIKKEIAYHGDAINIAARIQDKCGELNSVLLISDTLKDCLKDNNSFNLSFEGSFLLKGKNVESDIYSLSKIN